MKRCWSYREGDPWVSVRLIGNITIEAWALLDTGASYCVLHPEFIPVLGLEKIREISLYGFGSKKPVKADVVILEIDVNGFREKLEAACIREEYYPEKVPKVLIGRNFLNRYKVSLDGEEVCIEEKR